MIVRCSLREVLVKSNGWGNCSLQFCSLVKTGRTFITFTSLRPRLNVPQTFYLKCLPIMGCGSVIKCVCVYQGTDCVQLLANFDQE